MAILVAAGELWMYLGILFEDFCFYSNLAIGFQLEDGKSRKTVLV